VLGARQLQELIPQIFPQLAGAEPSWKKVSPKAIMRGSKKGWLVVLVAMAGAVMPLGWFAVAFLPVFPLIYLLNLSSYRHTGYWMDGNYLATRKGWFTRQTLYLPVRNVQNVSLTETPFDRRLGLASITVDTAGQTNTGGGTTIRNLPMEEARRIQEALAIRSGRVTGPGLATARPTTAAQA